MSNQTPKPYILNLTDSESDYIKQLLKREIVMLKSYRLPIPSHKVPIINTNLETLSTVINSLNEN